MERLRWLTIYDELKRHMGMTLLGTNPQSVFGMIGTYRTRVRHGIELR